MYDARRQETPFAVSRPDAVSCFLLEGSGVRPAVFGTLLATEPDHLKEELTVRCVEHREVLLAENSRHTPYSSTSITPAFNLSIFSMNRVVS